MKLVKEGKNKPLNLKAARKRLVLEAWDRLYPGDKEAEKQKEREALWAKEEVRRKAKGQL